MIVGLRYIYMKSVPKRWLLPEEGTSNQDHDIRLERDATDKSLQYLLVFFYLTYSKNRYLPQHPSC